MNVRYEQINEFSEPINIRVEEFNKYKKEVLFDFTAKSDFIRFSETIKPSISNNETIKLVDDSFFMDKSMVLLKNYDGNILREGSTYSLNDANIKLFNNDKIEEPDSYLVRYEIFSLQSKENTFNRRYINRNFEVNDFYIPVKTNTIIEKLSFNNEGQKLKIIVRNIGQGNWNEVCQNGEIKLVYDIGDPVDATKLKVNEFVRGRKDIYQKSKPILILSHWDKDHYHSILGMSNEEIKKCFSKFICRDQLPNITSERVFNKIIDSIGPENIFTIPTEVKTKRKFKKVTHIPLTPIDKKIVLYNSEESKNRNKSGFLLTIKSKSQNIILSGDAHYNDISNSILPLLNTKKINNIVVPHHGGNAGKYLYDIPNNSAGKAIISVGRNIHKHPFEHYIKALEKSGFKILQTKNSSNDIEIILD